ncbi:hypothetical protein CVD28_02310 [Bacillus sp. M6-12]|uniref:hypothetical protein n=1 Tax=Bacillus sp. M6-12 TaxID=2054166 RepID=UPI000C78E628|nr:hypothetical protein [Bacillus sp. M6-12]PLS19266.1 hypothetical protein CVD28_02310 [Bacillus sp. M6-12]
MNDSYKEILKELHRTRKFIQPDSPKLDSDLQQILSVLDTHEFFLHCNLNPAVSYNEAVFKACRKASMYVIYSISHKLRMGKFKLQDIQICDGFVGNTPHTWLLFKNELYLDLTLAQFTHLPIPEIAILPVDLSQDLYQVNHTFSWQEWVQLES